MAASTRESSYAILGAVFALVGISLLATMWSSPACVGAVLALLFAKGKSLYELEPFMLLFLY